MRKLVPILFAGISLGLPACQDKAAAVTTSPGAAPESAANQQFRVNSAALQQDFTTWWNYTYYNVHLSEDFVGLDVDSTIIPKNRFLARLTSGTVVPFKLLVRDGRPYYKLYPLNPARPDIRTTIMQTAAVEIEHFRREGQPLPAYRFTDLAGKTYTPASTKGQVVVIKCWYIGCTTCVKEFPAVNKLVDRYKGRKDIVFVSLAFDDQEDLTAFLRRNELKYATVPNMRDFMQGQLDVNSYPTHILLDRAGNIVKVVNTVEELKPFLAQQAATATL